MGRRFGSVFVLFVMVWMITACGVRNTTEYVLFDSGQVSNLSVGEREQQYLQFLENNVKEALRDLDVINDVNVEITDDAGVLDVTVEIDYSDVLSDTSVIGKSIEESLAKFFPEGTKLTITGGMTESEAFDRFLNNELPVFSGLDREWSIYYDDYCSGGFLEEEEYGISRLDLDNDGKEELVIDSVGHYGAAIIDFMDGILYFLAEGEGTAGICSYTFIEDEAWIVHSDTTHGGRQMFWFEKFNGDGEIVDQFTLSAEYWDEPWGRYAENSDFTYRDEKITMQEYENLRQSYIGW